MQRSKGAAWGNRKTREYRVWSIEYRESQKDVVSGDGHGQREFRRRPFGHQVLAPGFRRLMTERLTPERPTSVAVTRHLELIMPAGRYPVSGFPLRVAVMTSGLRSRLIGYQVRVFWYGYGCRPEPVPGVEYLNPGPDGCDPGPENGMKATRSARSADPTSNFHPLSHIFHHTSFDSPPCACFAIFTCRS
jgi:hypothetical protein